MQQHVESHSPRLGRLAPTIPVADVGRAVGFYVDVLGFRKVFENGSPTGFAILAKDDAELHLTLVRDHKPGTHNVAHLMVADADALCARLAAHGARIVKGLRDADFGLRCFVFADPDGNRIDVGQRLEAATPAFPFAAGAVVYAKRMDVVAAFYASIAGLRTSHAEAGYRVLETDGFQLVVVAMRPDIAAEVHLSSPPKRREDTAVKLVLPVAGIDVARAAATALGGQVDPPEREWHFQGSRVCDGHDPEGNVFQVRERA